MQERQCGRGKKLLQKRGRVCYVDFALLFALLFRQEFVLYNMFVTPKILMSVSSGMKTNDGRVLERWEWTGMQVKDTGWYNKR